MDFGSARLYEIELWTPNGSRVADISHLCTNRSYTLTRNDAEMFSFDIDLFAFEDYCLTKLGGADPNVLIRPYASDVKVKRAGQYLFGSQVVDINFNPQMETGSASQGGERGSSLFPVTVTCTGYLNLFKDRYISKTYTQVERTAIATDLVTTTQLQAYGSVGVTNNAAQFQTGLPADRTFQLDNIKLKLQELAQLSDAPFDLTFSADKVFTTVGRVGARRTDMSFVWGGPLSNVAGFRMVRSAGNLYNKIYGIGSGFGADQLVSTPGVGSDIVSQQNYYLRESVQQFNSVVLQETLDKNTQTALAESKDLLELPSIMITTKDITGAFISVGDRIPLQVMAHTWLSNINGLYRVEQMQVNIDENDFEQIFLTFDNYGVSQSE